MLLAVLIAIPLLLIWVLTLVDLVRRHDLPTSRKVLWALVVLLVPVVGVIAYFFARPSQPTDRAATLDGVGDESFEPIRRRHGPHSEPWTQWSRGVDGDPPYVWARRHIAVGCARAG